MGWNKQQVRAFASEIRHSYPIPAWNLLVFDLRQAVVDAYVARLLLGLFQETVRIEDVQKLSADLHMVMRTTEGHRP